MALLEDPTIQRILNDVNKAACDGALGVAGNYISESPNPMIRIQASKSDPFSYQQQQQVPILHPTPDMFGVSGISNFDQDLDLNSLGSTLPIAAPNNFDIYSSGLYNTMSQNALSPYESCKNDMLNSNYNTNQPMRTTSSVSSTNNDILLDLHRHQECPAKPAKITAAVPNLGLNLRTTSPLDSMAGNANEQGDEVIPNKAIDTATASYDLLRDKDYHNSLPSNHNDEIDPPHICEEIF